MPSMLPRPKSPILGLQRAAAPRAALVPHQRPCSRCTCSSKRCECVSVSACMLSRACNSLAMCLRCPDGCRHPHLIKSPRMLHFHVSFLKPNLYRRARLRSGSSRWTRVKPFCGMTARRTCFPTSQRRTRRRSQSPSSRKTRTTRRRETSSDSGWSSLAVQIVLPLYLRHR